MTYQERRDEQNAKNEWHRRGWRQGWTDRKNGAWAEPDDRYADYPGYTDGYYAGFQAQDVIAAHSKGCGF